MDNSKLKSKLDGKVQAMSDPAEQPHPTSLAPVETDYIALRGDTMDVIQANLKRQPLSLDLFDVVKSPAGGATVFSLPGLGGDEAEKDLTGIILDYTTPRAYWDTPVPTVRLMTSAPRTGRATPKRARNRCCFTCCGPTPSCPCWCGCP